MFVGCIVINLLSLPDFGRRLGLSPVDFGRRLSSRFCAVFVSCISGFLILSGFGRRLLSRIISLSAFGRQPCCLSGFGRRLWGKVICFGVSDWGLFFVPFPNLFVPVFLGFSLIPFPFYAKPFFTAISFGVG